MPCEKILILREQWQLSTDGLIRIKKGGKCVCKGTGNLLLISGRSKRYQHQEHILVLTIIATQMLFNSQYAPVILTAEHLSLS
jgi:hypothetical protein